jgi:peptide/nickel transport system substrate-binding protein
MSTSRHKAAAVLLAVGALVLTACGGSSSSSSGGGSAPKLSNAGVNKIANASDTKGGTLKLGLGGPWGDSFDPGNTYYGYSWDLVRDYARTLTMFKTGPGKEGGELTPDLATGLGKSSDGGKTWTYTLRQGLKFEDGTPITSKDVAYAVERTVDRAVLKLGPSYFADLLNWPKGYQGPYKSGKNVDVSSAVETPNATTIVFHLKAPFAEFDYLAQLPQTAPVPASKDTGAKYGDHPISSGPYMWKGTTNVNTGGTLVRNPNWDATTDPNRKALPDQIDVKLGMQADDLDNQIISGDQDVDIAGSGVQPAALSKVLQQPALEKRADNPVQAREWFTSIIGTVKPLDNIDCRKAIMYAMSPVSYQNAYGGSYAGGDLASTLLPPTVTGYSPFDIYGQKSHPKGQISKAKDELKKCGQPNGFSTGIGYRQERPKEKATAEAFQQSLAKVGIKLTVKPLSSDTYTSETCGKPSWVVANKVGLCVYGWGADWNTGYGYLAQITDSRVINPQGGAANFSVRDPKVDAMIDQLVAEPDATKRNQISTNIDHQVMEDAYIYPGLYAKAVFLRGKTTTNSFINNAFGMYDYTALGVKK